MAFNILAAPRLSALAALLSRLQGRHRVPFIVPLARLFKQNIGVNYKRELLLSAQYPVFQAPWLAATRLQQKDQAARIEQFDRFGAAFCISDCCDQLGIATPF